MVDFTKGDDIIYENFLVLNSEKKERILNAAFREFGRFGYKKTPVEQIAQSAGIAKGMIFHYFKSKLGLFEYLIEYAYNYSMDSFGDIESIVKNHDYITQYQYITKAKLNSYIKNPFIFEFLTMLFMHPENLKISDKVNSYYSKIIIFRENVLKTIKDTTSTEQMRDDIDYEKAKGYIGWIIEGYSQHLLSILNNQPLVDMDLDIYWKEFDEILDDLRKLFYVCE